MYLIDDYDYELPENLIAQTPAPQRDRSRLLHLKRAGGDIAHHYFQDIVSLLSPGDLLVVNDTRVIPGRLHGRKRSGGKVEALILDYASAGKQTVSGGTEERIFQCLTKASKGLRPETWIDFDPDLSAEVLSYKEGLASLRFVCSRNFETILEKIGRVPLPPYIRRDQAPRNRETQDRNAYQTVYAAHPGAIAAPTAGLHFTPEVLEALQENGIEVVRVTLHVGYGTFVPVRVADIRDHKMHSEWFTISPEAADKINHAKQDGRRIIAVGTTSVRTLEFQSNGAGKISAGSGVCDLFIYPGYRFKMIDGLITNFHLPRSTLIMLVSALAGKDAVLAAYRQAVASRYRFFSYGDAMLIL